MVEKVAIGKKKYDFNLSYRALKAYSKTLQEFPDISDLELLAYCGFQAGMGFPYTADKMEDLFEKHPDVLEQVMVLIAESMTRFNELQKKTIPDSTPEPPNHQKWEKPGKYKK